MTNHPHRSWRARMRAAADRWLITSEAGDLIDSPIEAQTEDAWVEVMHGRIVRAFEAGYAARKRDERSK